MKKSILILIWAFVPSLLMAQAAGGAITRPSKKVEKKVEPKKNIMTNKSTEAAGYDVTFICNAPAANIYIDGKKIGKVSENYFLKKGVHGILLRANGYEDFKGEIVVNSTSTIFSFELKKIEIVLPPIIKSLLNNMVQVEGGTFTMGATPEQCIYPESIENTPHSVTLSSYSISKYEVTQDEYEYIMGTNPSKIKGEKLPVTWVSWEDCNEFIHKLNALTGMNFRLPTEAEWEYAARGGKYSYGYKFSGGNSLDNVAWNENNSQSKPHKVGIKTPNELGLYDMSGNVEEWCWDGYERYKASSQTNPTGPKNSLSHIIRGGSIMNSYIQCLISFRKNEFPRSMSVYTGFRLAL